MDISFSTIAQGTFVRITVDTVPVQENTKRISRVATLDGGCVISNNGITDSDRTFNFTARQVPEGVRLSLWAFFQNETLVHLSCPEGVFSGYLEKVKIQNTDVAVSFLVYEKLTLD
jgi:hypothetical protein